MAHVGEEEARPAEAGVELGAAHVMHVVAIAVVGRAQRDDRLERRWPARRDLQRVEAAPRDAEHADHARAPWLGRQPGDDLERVVLLLLAVLVGQHTVGLAAAADVDAHRGIAVSSEIGVGERVALDVPSRLRYGRYSSRAGTGERSASSGSHRRAARRVPSDNGIQAFSISRIGRGKGGHQGRAPARSVVHSTARPRSSVIGVNRRINALSRRLRIRGPSPIFPPMPPYRKAALASI